MVEIARYFLHFTMKIIVIYIICQTVPPLFPRRAVVVYYVLASIHFKRARIVNQYIAKVPTCHVMYLQCVRGYTISRLLHRCTVVAFMLHLQASGTVSKSLRDEKY